MLKINRKHSVLILVISMILMTSCVNFTNIQSARTLGPDRKNDHYIYTRITAPVVNGELEGAFFVPEYVYKHRIKNNFDWGLKVGLDASLTGNVKYQFIGNSKSKFAMSVMPETGLSFFPTNGETIHSVPLAWRFETPILMTYHFSDHFYFTAAPKFLNYYTPKGHFTMLAATGGFQFGKKVNWTLAYSYYSVVNSPESTVNLGKVGHVFEVGLKFNMFKEKMFAPRFSFD